MTLHTASSRKVNMRRNIKYIKHNIVLVKHIYIILDDFGVGASKMNNGIAIF